MRRFAAVRFRVPGFHSWPDAPEERAYLRERHRHLFHVSVQVEVDHASREIEFHDLLDFCKMAWPMAEDGSNDWSCETMGELMMGGLRRKYPGRCVVVEVWEDGECGAVLVEEAVSRPLMQPTPGERVRVAVIE